MIEAIRITKPELSERDKQVTRRCDSHADTPYIPCIRAQHADLKLHYGMQRDGHGHEIWWTWEDD